MHFSIPTFFTVLTTYAMASTDPQPPSMTLLYHMEVKLGERFSLGSVPNGQERIVIPIVGGTFKGPRLSGNCSLFTSTVRAFSYLLIS